MSIITERMQRAQRKVARLEREVDYFCKCNDMSAEEAAASADLDSALDELADAEHEAHALLAGGYDR